MHACEWQLDISLNRSRVFSSQPSKGAAYGTKAGVEGEATCFATYSTVFRNATVGRSEILKTTYMQ
jgi:hypothetical protein